MNCLEFCGPTGQPLDDLLETPIVFAYEMEAVIPTKIDMPTTKTTIQRQRDEKQEFERHLD